MGMGCVSWGLAALMLQLAVVAMHAPQAAHAVGATSSLYIPRLFSETGTSEVTKVGDLKVNAVGFFHTFRPPPWGGGNQFLLALQAELRRRGVKVLDNEIKPSETLLYMANAITFKRPAFYEAYRKNSGRLKLVHRLDGPYYASRYGLDPALFDKAKGDKNFKEDEGVYAINKEFACASIFQSKWSLEMNLKLGYKPKEPVTIINNAIDHTIFHNASRLSWAGAKAGSRKIRLISSSWSNGERKGFNTFKWLDHNLDYERFDYTFIGNVKEGFTYENIEVKQPVGSEVLAPILRNHDIYIAASFLEPCSNALIEALASGLPTLYQDGSGHNELVKEGGLAYQTPDQIPALLDQLVENYEYYQSKIRVMSIAEVADRYLAVYQTCLYGQVSKSSHSPAVDPSRAAAVVPQESPRSRDSPHHPRHDGRHHAPHHDTPTHRRRHDDARDDLEDDDDARHHTHHTHHHHAPRRSLHD